MAINDRTVKVGIVFSDQYSIRIDELYNLIEFIDELNNMSTFFYNNEKYGHRNSEEFKFSRINSYSGIIKNNPSQITAINKNSPLTIEIVLSSIGAFLTIIHIAERIRDWNVKKETSKLELEKLRYETREKYIEMLKKTDQYLLELEEGHHSELLQEMITKFDDNPLKLRGIKILEEEEITSDVRIKRV